MTKCKAREAKKSSEPKELSYDLDGMTPAEEQQFWYEFETLLLHARDRGNVLFSKVSAPFSKVSAPLSKARVVKGQCCQPARGQHSA